MEINSFSNIFCHFAELWLEWLRDEIKLSSSDEDKEKIEGLFKRATQDYLSKKADLMIPIEL